MTRPSHKRTEEIYCGKTDTESQDKSSVKSISKICFNPCCNNKGANWITIVGRFAGYSDYGYTYYLCDECTSIINIRLQMLNDLDKMLQGMGRVDHIGVKIEADSFLLNGKLTITTKDLDNLTFATESDGMTESDEDYKPKICYNSHCSNQGTHRIDIVNATTRLKDHEIAYCICDECYAFFGYRRRDPLVFPSLKALFDGKEENVYGISPVTGKEVITTKDLQKLLESTREN